MYFSPKVVTLSPTTWTDIKVRLTGAIVSSVSQLLSYYIHPTVSLSLSTFFLGCKTYISIYIYSTCSPTHILQWYERIYYTFNFCLS